MSRADELLDTLSEDDVSVFTVEPHIVINSDRTITVPNSLKRIAVQYDHNIETVTFDCPRYWDERDMSTMQVYINYRRPDGELGSYIVDSIAVDNADSSIMHFDWTISKSVTQAKGTLTFLICVKKVDIDSGEEVNHWNSELSTDMYVSEGLECDDHVQEFYPDIITQLLLRMDSVEGCVGPIEEKVAAAAKSASEAADSALAAAHNSSKAQESAAAATDNADRASALAAQASASADAAHTAQTAAAGSASAAANSAASALAAASAASESATAAKASEDNAAQSATDAAVAKQGAETAKTAAETARDAAKTAQDNAEAAAETAATEAAQKTDELLASKVAAAQTAQRLAEEAQSAAETARNAAQSSAEASAGSAAQSKLNADSVDPEQINARINAKGDNLEFDEGEGLLYLTSGGERIGDGIKVITSGGGGGGGGESNNAVLTLTNTTGWIYKSIAYGAACPISVNWTSLENDLATGSGVLQIIVAGSLKYTAQVEQGDLTIDVGPWLPVGSTSVKVKVTDVYGNSRSLNFNLTAVSLTLESSFNASVAYSGDITYSYTPTGTAAKIVHFKLDGTELDTATVTASGRQQTMTIPAQSHGSHTFEVWFTATVDGETVESNHLYYDIICIEEGNTTPIIATSFRGSTAEQYDSISIPYIVYDPAGLTAAVVLAADGVQVASLTVDRTEQVWTYRADKAGDLTLSITCGNAIKLISLTVMESTIDVTAETNSLALYLSSYGRSNNEENPGVWQNGSISAELTGFNWTSDGWKADADGITALRVAGDARVTIPLNIFAQDFRTTGKTIEVEFATRDVLDYDAVVISCWSGDRGLKITAQKAQLKSEQSEISTQYKEDEHVRLAFVVQKRSEYRLLLVYINGILSGAVQYPSDDDFSQSSPVGISIGSNSCTTDVYCIRVYDNDLTRFQVLDNWIADTQVGLTKKERYNRNKVFDDYSQIVIDQLPQDLPYLILEAAVLPQYKGDKKTVSGRYVDPVTPGNSFTFTGAQANVQGTSSQYYARKNYKIKFKGGFTKNGSTSPSYQLRPDSVPTDTFTFKADVASSEGANNVELVRLYNEACPYRTPPQKTDSTVRQGIDGFPIVVFHDAGDGPKFIGKYNFNNDKGTPEVYGFADGDESWEIRNNTSDRVLWKSDDFTGTDWQNDFEGRYPEDNTNTVNLAALATWLKSTDQSAVTTNEEKAARLAKFKAELADHLDVDSTLFYYLFTELFLMVDSRAKNAFPSKFSTDKWCWLPYDMDTAIGTNNEGQLVFGYELEDIDQVGTADVFNGQNSVLWVNLRQAFHDELMAMYQTLRSQGKLSYADTEARFEGHQAKWPEAVFNEDSFYKYLEPLFSDGSGAYLGMLQGSKAEQRKWWLYNRFRYLDSKYNAGDSLSDVITVRGYAKSNITVEPYADIYASVKYGSYLVQTRALRGSSYTLECPLDNVNDTEIYIYSASQIKDVGDLSGLKVGYAEFSMATKLQSLKLGDISNSTKNLFDSAWLQSLRGWQRSGDEYFGTAQAVYNKYKTSGVPFPFPAFKANTQYTFSLKAKVSGVVTSSNCFRFMIYYTDSSYSYACTVLNNTSDYTELVDTSTVNKTIDHVNVSYGDGLSNTLYLKEIQVEEGAVATSFIQHASANDIKARAIIGRVENTITEDNLADLINFNEVVSGSIYPNASGMLVHKANSKRLHLAEKLNIAEYVQLNIGVANGWRVYGYQLDENGAYLTRSGWKTSDYTEVLVDNAVYYQCVFGLVGDSADVTPDDKSNLEIYALPKIFKELANIAVEEAISPYHVPSYWDTEITTSEASIQANELSMGENGVEFFFVTDTHWSENAKHSGEIIAKMSHDLSIPLVVFGGDAIDTHSATKAGAVGEIRTFYDAYNKDFNLYSCIGNHDLNSNNNADTDTWLSDSELYALMMRRQESFMNADAKVYNYYDNESQKVRFIQFKTVNGDALSQTILDWIDARVNELSSEWTVVLLSHVYFNGATAGNPVTISAGAASNAQHFASLNSSADATIACWIVGHVHRDVSDTTNGILVIGTSCDVYTQSAPWGGPTMTLGTDTEQCIDCYQIDTANKTIKITRIGAGYDRSFNY